MKYRRLLYIIIRFCLRVTNKHCFVSCLRRDQLLYSLAFNSEMVEGSENAKARGLFSVKHDMKINRRFSPYSEIDAYTDSVWIQKNGVVTFYKNLMRQKKRVFENINNRINIDAKKGGQGTTGVVVKYLKGCQL